MYRDTVCVESEPLMPVEVIILTEAFFLLTLCSNLGEASVTCVSVEFYTRCSIYQHF